MRKERVPRGSSFGMYVCSDQKPAVSIGEFAGCLDSHRVGAAVEDAVQSGVSADMGVATGAAGDDECAAKALVAACAVGRGGAVASDRPPVRACRETPGVDGAGLKFSSHRASKGSRDCSFLE